MSDIYIKVEVDSSRATRDIRQVEAQAEQATRKMLAMSKATKSATQNAFAEMSKRAAADRKLLQESEKAGQAGVAATLQQVQAAKQATAAINQQTAATQRLAATQRTVAGPGRTGLMGGIGTAAAGGGAQQATAAAAGWSRTQQAIAQTFGQATQSVAQQNAAFVVQQNLLGELDTAVNRFRGNLRFLGKESPLADVQMEDLNTVLKLQNQLKTASTQAAKTGNWTQYQNVLSQVENKWTNIRDTIFESADFGLKEINTVIRQDTLPAMGKLEAGMTRVRRTVAGLKVGTQEWARQSELLARMDIFRRELGSKDPVVRAEALARYGREADQLFRSVDEGARKADKRMSVFNGRFAKMAVYMSGIAATIFVFQNLVQLVGALMRPFLDTEKAAMGLRKEFGAVETSMHNLNKLVQDIDFSGAMNITKATERLSALKKEGYNTKEAIELLKNEIYELDNLMAGTTTGSLERFKAGMRELFGGLGKDVSAGLKPLLDALRQILDVRKIQEEFPEIFPFSQGKTMTGDLSTSITMGVLRHFGVDKRKKAIADAVRENASDILSAMRMPIDIGLPGSEADIQADKAIRERTQRIIQNSETALKTAHEVSGRMNEALIYDFKENLREVTEALTLFGENTNTIAGVRAEMLYQQTRAVMKPFYDASKEAYNVLGKITDTYYNEEAARIKHGADVIRRLVSKEYGDMIEERQMFALKQKAIIAKEVGMSEDQIKALNKLFADTKFFDPRLGNLQKIQASIEKERSIQLLGEGVRPQAEYVEALRNYETLKDSMQKRMDLNEQFYKETKIMSKEYYNDQVTLIRAETDLAIQGGMDRTKAYEIQVKRLENLDDQRSAYAVSKWKDMYSDLNYMSDEYYRYQLLQLERERREIIEATEDYLGAWEWFYRELGKLKSKQILADKGSTAADAVQLRMQQVKESTRTEAEKGLEVLNEMLNTTEQNFQSFFKGIFSGEINSAKDMLASLGESFGNMVQDMAAKALAANLMQSLFGGLVEGGGAAGSGLLEKFMGPLTDIFTPTGTPTGHFGGRVGSTSFPRKMVSPFVFAGAPRLHSGLAADEYPAILQRGETIIPRNGAVVAAPVDVVVNNYGNDKVRVSEQSQPGGRRQVQVSIAEDIYKRGPLAQSMENVYGLKRTGRNI